MEKRICLKAERKPFQGNNEAEKFWIYRKCIFIPGSCSIVSHGEFTRMALKDVHLLPRNKPLLFWGGVILLVWGKYGIRMADCWARDGKLDRKRRSLRRGNGVFSLLGISHPKVSWILRWKIGSTDVQWYNTQVDFEKCVFITSADIDDFILE